MASSAAAEEAITRVKAYIEEQAWSYTFDPETSTFQVEQHREGFDETLYFRIGKEREEFLFYIVPQFSTPPGVYPEVAEYLARVNCGMRIGNFEFNYDTGKFMFKSSLAFTGDRLSLALVKAAVKPAMTAWAEYLPGVIRVVAGMTPVQALTEIDYRL